MSYELFTIAILCLTYAAYHHERSMDSENTRKLQMSVEHLNSTLRLKEVSLAEAWAKVEDRGHTISRLLAKLEPKGKRK